MYIDGYKTIEYIFLLWYLKIKKFIFAKNIFNVLQYDMSHMSLWRETYAARQPQFAHPFYKVIEVRLTTNVYGIKIKKLSIE